VKISFETKINMLLKMDNIWSCRGSYDSLWWYF